MGKGERAGIPATWTPVILPRHHAHPTPRMLPVLLCSRLVSSRRFFHLPAPIPSSPDPQPNILIFAILQLATSQVSVDRRQLESQVSEKLGQDGGRSSADHRCGPVRGSVARAGAPDPWR